MVGLLIWSLLLESFEGLNRVRVRSIRCRESIASNEGANGLEQQLNILERVVALHLLVQVAVEGHSLHIFTLAEFNEGFSSSIGSVEYLQTKQTSLITNFSSH